MEVGNIGWVGKMEENTELEEGEACYKDRDDNIDLGSLSCIDERIQHVLGHFQKDFEGGVSAENLGAKFGGYGTFLPSYECSPFRSHPKTSQKNYLSLKSPYNNLVEATSNNSTVPSRVPPSTRLGTAPCGTNSLQNARAFSIDDSMNKDVGISSSVGAESFSFNDDSTDKSGKPTDQRTLKFRIKMKYDNLAQKNAAIYSGLGLDTSPSSSMDNSPIETGRVPPVSQQTGEQSPTGIIQAMTSFPIPGGVLISPLQESMLYLKRREKIHGDGKSLSALNGQENCSMSDDSESIMGEEDLLKKKKVRILHPKKRLGNKTPDCKDFLFNDLKGTPLFSSFCDAGKTAEMIGRASEVSKKVSKDGANGRMVSTEAVKEELLESISGQDFDNSDKKHMGSGSRQRVIERKPANSLKNNSLGPNNNGQGKGSISSQKADLDVIKCFGEDSQKVETNRKGKLLSDGKHKSKGDQSPSKAVAIAKKDTFEAGNNEMVNNKKSSGFGDDSKSKMAKTKSSKYNDVGGSGAHSLKHDEVECIADGTDPVDGSKYEVKIKERQSSDKMEKLICGPGIKDALNACPVARNKSAPEMVQTAAAPQLIEENWVCCDRCQKWRLLPIGIKPEQLPEKWLCSMLNWLPGMNRCDISEETTTKALYASCQMPTSEGLNNIQNSASGAATGLGSAGAWQLGLAHQNSFSDALSDQRKKKLGAKEKKKAEISTDNLLSSDATQNRAEESGKIPSHEHHAEGNLMRRPISQQYSKLNSLIEAKHIPKEKEKKMNGGDGKHGKLKRKMEADKHQPRTLVKQKTENIYVADTQLSPGMDLEKVAQNSINGFPTKASGKDMRKYDEYCLYEDVADKLAGPVKKQGDQTQVLSDHGSLDLKSHSENGSSLNKRKSEDWQDANKLHNMSLQDDRQYGKGSASGCRKEKKFKVLNPEAKLCTESEYKMKRKDEMNQSCLSGSKNHAAIGAEVGSVDKIYPQRKHDEKFASSKVLDDGDPLGRDLGSGLLSLAATSSSSKVSSSHKCKTNHADMKGSPVESVTSSPLRIPNDRKGKLPVKAKEERVSCDFHSESLKFASIGSHVGDAEDKAGIQAKTSEVRDNHLLNFDVATVQQHGHCANCKSRVNKCNQESALSWEKSGKVAPLRGKEEDKWSGSEVDRNKTKFSASENGYFKNSGGQESAADPNCDAFSRGSKSNAKCSFAKSKCEGKKNSVRLCPGEIGKQTELRRKDSEKSDPKVDASFSTSKEILSQENLIQDLEDGNKVDTVCSESRDGKSKVLSSWMGEEKGETLSGSRTACESKKGDTCIEHPIHASTSGDVGKLTKISAGASGKGGVNCSSGASGADRPFPGTIPVRKNSSQMAYDTLKEATNLKDRADHFKSSGFEFESNETFFEAALKFLHGASLLENFDKESSKHGNISQMQAYTTAAKLFASCADEYERHHEIAAAALAHKCMEVAYMRVAYSKHSSINRDRNELQSTLQPAPQGESPSSSASDVDNLNNQAAADKFTLLRGTGTHVVSNQVISARHRSKFARLLDFTQDVNYAMEASRKCQSAFAGAIMIMEEARNGDCLTSMRRVIDLSFQDVDELVGLVWTARKAISRAHLSGARD
ncbi:uncharacterized protein LOC114711340 [Neltuma alba]|uniref:uncharacterized protein LOC114711340 n=1 Tax=Neltuma alba TaxID=207710 RepID=UPI0010A4BF6E|nr:uncharacterized protein LOC114711340 [Prosopis alba]